MMGGTALPIIGFGLWRILTKAKWVKLLGLRAKGAPVQCVRR